MFNFLIGHPEDGQRKTNRKDEQSRGDGVGEKDNMKKKVMN